MKIFPKEILERTTQYYIPQNTVKSKWIYGSVLLTCMALLCSLPFLKVVIFSSARGYIKPNRERVILSAVNSGKVAFLNLTNNDNVKKGDTLLVIQNTNLREQLQLFTKRKSKLTSERNDLNYLLHQKTYRLKNLHTPNYQKQLIAYQAGLQEHFAKLKKLKIDFERNQKLYEKGVIAKVEFEDITLEHDLAKNQLYQYKKQQLNSWQARLTELEATLQELESETSITTSSNDNFVLTAPISGTLINVSGMDKGSFVSAGTTLAEITPDTDLIAECYVSPSDIGLLDPNKKVTFQIDAFNYNQWGTATGKITTIGKDVEFMDNQPLYRIQCKLDQDFLRLKNGYQGTLGKGMTLNARFELAERTLYQLLYDKVDDWVNPGSNELAYSNGKK